ncbi:hypothetical protein GBA52_025465 [Prunus armeniaca]|nr:hypothetical protein GBA52_025465 [Prunus armeniaca]
MLITMDLGTLPLLFTKCLGSIWTGKDRYIWIDLGAGPVDYGPALSGDGVLPRGEFHPLAALHGRPKAQKALLADLASLFGVLTSKDSSGLDWKSIVRTFMDEAHDNGLACWGDQSLRFKTYRVGWQGFPEEDFGRVLPVYVFDLDYSMLLLLDRQGSLSDRLLVRFYRACGECHQPICCGALGTILHWWITTWSVGQTPFGPFSEVSSLSFVQKDAARRNVLLTSLNYSITSAVDVLESISCTWWGKKAP